MGNFLLLLALLVVLEPAESKPFFKPLGHSTWAIGNDMWNITVGDIYAKKLYFRNLDLIGSAKGHYAGHDGDNNFVWISARIHKETPTFLDVVFSSTEVDLHWVIFNDLAGAYQYLINRALPSLGVLRTLFRLDNSTFTRGRTNIKDEALPPLNQFAISTKVQDETWIRADGSFITKYDWSTFIRDMDFFGVYGSTFGSWYIRPGMDYFNANHLKQELTVHRESRTGDAVELNVMHGSHFQSNSKAQFPVGKMWGPWLWYLNNGSRPDVSKRAQKEFSEWPYQWLDDSAYQSRGSVSGRLILSDNRPAGGAFIFLGDKNSNAPTLNQGRNYYYTAAADEEGRFVLQNVRTGSYKLSAWSNGGKIGDVTTNFTLDGISIRQNSQTDLGSLSWKTQSRRKIFQIGSFDHKALGFHLGGAPYQHGLDERCPPDLTYDVGRSSETDWCFAQSVNGSWIVRFDVSTADSRSIPSPPAVLTMSFAGYSKGASMKVKLNSKAVGTLRSLDIPSDPALYRSGTTAGEWHLFKLDIAPGLLQAGSNRLAFQVTNSVRWHGFMWDSILLEWKREIPNAIESAVLPIHLLGGYRNIFPSKDLCVHLTSSCKKGVL